MAKPPVQQRASRLFKETLRYRSATKVVGAKVRKIREELSLTLEAASAAMDVDLKHLQKVEAGQLNVTLATLLRIADGLEVPVHSLFSEVPLRSPRKARKRLG